MSGTYDDAIRSSIRAPPPDFSDRYNTKLTPSQEAAFLASPHANDVFDYDARGEYLAGLDRNNPTGHGQDTFKKPNHPTFSTGSMYHGVDGYTGGAWLQLGDGSWQFTPSSTNLTMYPMDQLQQYFNEREPNNRIAPPQER